LEAAGLHAVLADVAHQKPPAVLPRIGELLDELHVAPVNAVEPERVVVAQAADLRSAAVPCGELVPLLARDLAGLAADADRRVRVEAHWLSHKVLLRCQLPTAKDANSQDANSQDSSSRPR